MDSLQLSRARQLNYRLSSSTKQAHSERWKQLPYWFLRALRTCVAFSQPPRRSRSSVTHDNAVIYKQGGCMRFRFPQYGSCTEYTSVYARLPTLASVDGGVVLLFLLEPLLFSALRRRTLIHSSQWIKTTFYAGVYNSIHARLRYLPYRQLSNDSGAGVWVFVCAHRCRLLFPNCSNNAHFFAA